MVVTGPVRAQEKSLEKIEVFPPSVQLDSSRDFQTIIVQATRNDGVTEDVTIPAKMFHHYTRLKVQYEGSLIYCRPSHRPTYYLLFQDMKK